MSSVLTQISYRRDKMRRSERKVADTVLEAPELVLRESLAGLAKRADVSEPTVIRFCRALDCQGFSDFKLQLAQALAAGAPYIHSHVTAEDDLPTVIDKVIASSANGIASLRDSIDVSTIERATGALLAANRIDCYGVGAAALAALDAQQKFMRLGVPTTVSLEGHMQTMSAATLRPGDVALAFSYTGQIRDILRTAETAIDQGAFVIAVTRTDSALSKIASMTIAIDTNEDTFVYAPMATRLAHMACVDILATSVAVARHGDMPAMFQKIKASLDDQHIVEAATPRNEPDAKSAGRNGHASSTAPAPTRRAG